MARIRTIKPEFWRSPSTASVSPWARLLFIAMWNWADDHGRAEWTPRELLGFAFPHDTESPCTDADFPRLLAEVRRAFEVKFYVNGGRRFYEIPSWGDHQKTERRAGDRFPHANDPESLPDQGIPGNGGDSADSGGFTEATGGNGGAGTGEQGNRGTEEQGTGEQSLRRSEIAGLFETAWTHWPKKVEKKPALEKFIKLANKHDPEWLAGEIARFGDAYAATTDRQFVPGLLVWLNRERWTDELPEQRGGQVVDAEALAIQRMQEIENGSFRSSAAGEVRAYGDVAALEGY